jgi:hypothetical protein
MFLEFAGIGAKDFKKAVAGGRSDEEMDRWLREHAKNESKEEVVRWNNDLRYKRISEMDGDLQVFLEDYIDENIPGDRVVYYWFDVYDIEEGRL